MVQQAEGEQQEQQQNAAPPGQESEASAGITLHARVDDAGRFLDGEHHPPCLAADRIIRPDRHVGWSEGLRGRSTQGPVDRIERQTGWEVRCDLPRGHGGIHRGWCEVGNRTVDATGQFVDRVAEDDDALTFERIADAIAIAILRHHESVHRVTSAGRFIDVAPSIVVIIEVLGEWAHVVRRERIGIPISVMIARGHHLEADRIAHRS